MHIIHQTRGAASSRRKAYRQRKSRGDILFLFGKPINKPVYSHIEKTVCDIGKYVYNAVKHSVFLRARIYLIKFYHENVIKKYCFCEKRPNFSFGRFSLSKDFVFRQADPNKNERHP